MSGPRDKPSTLTGLDALAEMARRIKSISTAVEEMIETDGGETVKSFTIDTGKGPLNGVFGMNVKTLKDMPGARSAPRPQRPSASKPQAEPQAPTRLVDVFDEEDAVLVIIDAQGENDLALGGLIKGSELTLFHTSTKATFQVVTLPSDFEGMVPDVSVTNGIVTVRIPKITSPNAL